MMIRPFHQNDKTELLEIFRLNTPVFFAEEETKEFDHYLANHPETYFIIESNGQMAGGVGCEYRESDKTGRINWIFLHPDFKKKNLGKEAVNHCLNEFKKNLQIEKLIVRTSQYAWNFFSSFGYRLVETKTNYWAPGIDLYLMEMTAAGLKAIQAWNNVAESYKNKFNDLKIYHESYHALISRLPEGANVLEAGCGPGTITTFLRENRIDLSITAFDLSVDMIRHAKESVKDVKFRVMDCRDLSQLSERYDGIICGFCLPYLNPDESEKFISDSERLLTCNGILYLSFIESAANYSHLKKSSDGKNELQINYYSAEFIEKALKNNGFSLTDQYAIHYPETNDIHKILIATKHH